MRKCNAGAAPSGGGGALLGRPAVRSEGRGSLVVDSVATQDYQKPLRSHSVVISKAGPSRAIFSNAARTENFHSRSLASSAKYFHFYVTCSCVDRTGKRWFPTQVDFEPSNTVFGATLRHVNRCDTNVTRGFELRRTVELRSAAT